MTNKPPMGSTGVADTLDRRVFYHGLFYEER
jgi:hypothetical protein